MTNYYGYDVRYEQGHVKVTAPDGSSWTEDTVEDAYREIRERICVKYWRDKEAAGNGEN